MKRAAVRSFEVPEDKDLHYPCSRGREDLHYNSK